jgi:hypothetical protein
VLVYSTSGSYGTGVYALITDHLGAVVAVADSTERLVETFEYAPFGKTTIRQQPTEAQSPPLADRTPGNTPARKKLKGLTVPVGFPIVSR